MDQRRHENRHEVQVLDRVRTLGGVRTASLSVLTPLSGRSTGAVVTAPGFEPADGAEPRVQLNHVSEDYFRTFGIGVASGRDFTRRDSGRALKVAMVNEA